MQAAGQEAEQQVPCERWAAAAKLTGGLTRTFCLQPNTLAGRGPRTPITRICLVSIQPDVEVPAAEELGAKAAMAALVPAAMAKAIAIADEAASAADAAADAAETATAEATAAEAAAALVQLPEEGVQPPAKRDRVPTARWCPCGAENACLQMP